jgi:hypothetical protein
VECNTNRIIRGVWRWGLEFTSCCILSCRGSCDHDKKPSGFTNGVEDKSNWATNSLWRRIVLPAAGWLLFHFSVLADRHCSHLPLSGFVERNYAAAEVDGRGARSSGNRTPPLPFHLYSVLPNLKRGRCHSRVKVSESYPLILSCATSYGLSLVFIKEKSQVIAVPLTRWSGQRNANPV